ncbi:MAG: lipocalin family protein [Phycisphaerae bacterium]|nr:lipocalin family protein [Phycisphaerae bacterium]
MTLSNEMQRISRWTALVGMILSIIISGCYRSSPPEIAEFKPPPKKAELKTTPEVVTVSAEVIMDEENFELEPELEPEPEPGPVAVAAVPQAAPQVVEKAAAASTIVGTWKVTEMTQRGESMPPELQMELTFGQDGTMTLSMFMEGMPEAMSMSGTYTLSGNQITITMEMDPESKTGTYSLAGNTLTIEMEGERMVLTRA